MIDAPDADAPSPAIARGTLREQQVAKLARQSFLRLWTVPNPYRDQGRGAGGSGSGKGDGKELCDLLVVFGYTVVVFSVKDCEPGITVDPAVAWSRWYRAAVASSADQVFGAERWLRRPGSRVFADKHCTVEVPMHLPPPDRMRVHRVIVALGHSARGGGPGAVAEKLPVPFSGAPSPRDPRAWPALVGVAPQPDPARGFVHIFSDASLDRMLEELDTTQDLVDYLVAKEALAAAVPEMRVVSEEDLLAAYLRPDMTKDARTFTRGDGTPVDDTAPGDWERFAQSPQRQARREADAPSYAWDQLIDLFAEHLLAGTSSYRSHTDIREIELGLRALAQSGRTERRMLSSALLDAMEIAERGPKRTLARTVAVPPDPRKAYVLCIFDRKPAPNEKAYRDMRRGYLEYKCFAAKQALPTVQEVVGIAVDTPTPGEPYVGSEDFLHLDLSGDDPARDARFEELRATFGTFDAPRTMSAAGTSEYPLPWEPRSWDPPKPGELVLRRFGNTLVVDEGEARPERAAETNSARKAKDAARRKKKRKRKEQQQQRRRNRS